VNAPVTNKKVRVLLAEDEWTRVELPELRVIEQDVWANVQKRVTEASQRTRRKRAQSKTQRHRFRLRRRKASAARSG
jgi:hypothetical protein